MEENRNLQKMEELQEQSTPAADPIREIIIRQYDRMLSDGTIENMVKEALNKQIENVIRDSFSAYRGQARELISKKLEEIIIPALEESNFGKMTTKLSTVINDALVQSNVGAYAGVLNGLKAMAGVPAVQNFQTVKASEIFKEYMRYIEDYAYLILDPDCCSEDEEDGSKHWNVTCSMEIQRDSETPTLRGWWNVELACQCMEDGALSEDGEEKLRFRFRIRESYGNKKRITLDGPEDLYDLTRVDRFALYLAQIRNHFCDIEIDGGSFEDDMEVACEE